MRFFVCCIFVLALSVHVNAAPSIFGPMPTNNSFSGRGSINFSVNVTSSSLDTSTVRLFVISEDAYIHGETWDNYTMQCASYQQDSWTCKKAVSFSIAGTDTLEFFYFEATDADGKSSLGDENASLRFKIDRTPPEIIFMIPKNNTFVSGIADLEITTKDGISGVNLSTVRFSIDNTTWNDVVNGAGQWNSSAYSNNQTVIIYVTATDNVGNINVSNISVIVDNEAPSILVISPHDNEVLKDVVTLKINVSDRYSGVDKNNVKYIFGYINKLLICQVPECTATLNTSVLSDAKYNLTFIANDKAGNVNSVSVPVTTKNEKPVISIAPVIYLRNSVTINVSITNPADTITDVSLKVGNDLAKMSCSSDFTSCSYKLDTKSFADGAYTLTANANNTAGYNLRISINSVIDNTNPAIEIDTKSIVKGGFAINAVIKDNNNANSAAISINGADLLATCLPHDKDLYCTVQYNSAQLKDGVYAINVSTTDLAGNFFSAIKIVNIDNIPPELVWLRISPPQSNTPAEITIIANISDSGTDIQSAAALVESASDKTTIQLRNTSGLWLVTYYVSDMGGHKVDIVAADESGNSQTFETAGYFFIGSLSCGDGVCQSQENYCLCRVDCYAPSCPNGGVECGSGLPQCPGQSTGGAVANPRGVNPSIDKTHTDNTTQIGSKTPKTQADFTNIPETDPLILIPVVVITILAAIIIKMLIRKRRAKKVGSFI